VSFIPEMAKLNFQHHFSCPQCLTVTVWLKQGGSRIQVQHVYLTKLQTQSRKQDLGTEQLTSMIQHQ